MLGVSGEGWETGKIPLKKGVWEPVNGLKLNCDLEILPAKTDFGLFEQDNDGKLLDIPRVESDKTVKSTPDDQSKNRFLISDRPTTIELRNSNKSHSVKSSSKSKNYSATKMKE